MLRLALYFVPVIVFVGLVAVFAGDLPERMASSFDFEGYARDSMSARAFVVTLCVLVGVLSAMFAGIAALIPRLPDELVNIPNKQYWFAPERRAATLERIATILAITNCAVLLLLDAIFVGTVFANRATPARLDPLWFWPVLGVFLAATFGAVLWLCLGFRMPRDAR